jgi:hypothetical protein
MKTAHGTSTAAATVSRAAARRPRCATKAQQQEGQRRAVNGANGKSR